MAEFHKIKPIEKQIFENERYKGFYVIGSDYPKECFGAPKWIIFYLKDKNKPNGLEINLFSFEYNTRDFKDKLKKDFNKAYETALKRAVTQQAKETIKGFFNSIKKEFNF